MDKEIDVKEMVSDLFDEVKDTSLMNEIRYFDWEEHSGEYLDILKSLVDTGADQFTVAYLENVPNWVYIMSFVCLLGLTTDIAQKIIQDQANYAEMTFTTPLITSCRMKVTKEENSEQYDIGVDKTKKSLIHILAVFKPDPEDEDKIKLNMSFAWDKGNTFVGRKVIGFITMFNLFYITSFFYKNENM